ncbi:MAG: hypothetical protein ACREX8_01080 [Gammaproteobacteria bacterium]
MTVGTGVLTDSSGFFRDSFTLPASAAPGAYVVVARVNTTDVDGHGRTYEAREAFTVVVPPPARVTPPPGAIQRPILAPALGTVFPALKTTLTLRPAPRRDKRLPFRYRFSGRVRIPAGMNKAAVCRGKVKLYLRKGTKTVTKGTARLSRSCAYKRNFKIANTRRTGKRHGKLKVTGAFGGNARLMSSKQNTTVRFF